MKRFELPRESLSSDSEIRVMNIHLEDLSFIDEFRNEIFELNANQAIGKALSLFILTLLLISILPESSSIEVYN